MSDTKESLIKIENLTWWYPDAPSFVFENFNMDLDEKDFCFILWKSGIWKTTLVKFLIRQLTPPNKMIFYKKEDIARFSDKEVQKYRRKMWVMFQDFKLIDYKTVKENVELPLEIMWAKSSVIKEKVNELLYNLNLMEKRNVYIPNLSGWEKQRVAIARALVGDPEFIIADEPTGNVDKQASNNIADTLIKLNKLWNTILFITHDLELVEYVSKKHPVKKIKI